MPQFARYYRVDIRGRYLGQLTVNTFYYGIPQPAIHADEKRALAVSFNESVGSVLKVCCVSQWVWETTKVARLSVNRGERDADSFGPSSGVQRNLPGVPPAVAVVVRRRVASVTPAGGRGRVFIPAIAIEDTTAGTLVSGSPSDTRLNTFAGAMLVRLPYTLFTLDVPDFAFPVHVFKRALPGPPPQVGGEQLSTSSVDRILRTCRKRSPGHGLSG